MIVLKIKKLNNKAKIPMLATDGSACFDLSTVEDVMINKGRLVKVHTGISVEIPIGYCIEVYPRSGIAGRGVIIPNSPAIIDSDYRGEIMINMYGLFVERVEVFGAGSRIAQARLVKTVPTIIKVVSHLSDTTRGEGGFGSTGVQSL
jgi:dUTP pyrophosphatase